MIIKTSRNDLMIVKNAFTLLNVSQTLLFNVIFKLSIITGMIQAASEILMVVSTFVSTMDAIKLKIMAYII